MKKAILIVTASIGLGAMANAQATSMQFISMDRSDALTGSITVSGSTKSVYLGAIKFKEGSDFLTTYCVDPLNALNGSNNPYNKSILNTGDGTGLGLAGKILAANFTSALRGYEGAIYRIRSRIKAHSAFHRPAAVEPTQAPTHHASYTKSF